MTSMAAWPTWLAAQFFARRARQRLREEFAALGPDETGRTLREAGLSPEQLPDIIRRHPQANDLLVRLMAALGIDRGMFQRKQPEALRDLEIRCTSCRTWRRCRRELSAGTAQQNFEAYCPNADELNTVRAVRPI